VIPPLLSHLNVPREYVTATIRYGKDVWLDVWAKASSGPNAPVLLYIPGGAWMIGHRRPQGYALMKRMVDLGWVCVAIDYRTAPRHRWPAPFNSVANAYLWTYLNIADWGGNPNFIALAGASAGGHMASLYGLTWDRHDPRVDRPAAVVSFYGVYDWRPQVSLYSLGLTKLLETVIVGKSYRSNPEIFHDASPIIQVRKDAPPFLIIHGTGDWLTPVAGARRFFERLAAESTNPVAYLEIPGAVHGFDLVSDAHAADAIDYVEAFFNRIRFGAKEAV